MSDPRALDVIPYERDVDLLLLEEVYANSGFRSWLVQQVMGDAFDPGPFISAHHSVGSQFGESDLELRFVGNDGGGWRLLIENKIDASLQPRQAERYGERGNSYIATGDCVAFAAVLVAPAGYINEASATGFTAAVSYEDIVNHLRQATDSPARLVHRIRFLERAIERGMRSSTADSDPLAMRFWQEYRDLVDAEFRYLNMAGKRDAPRRGGTWAEFVPAGLPTNCWRIVHDVGSGVAYLMFPHMSQRLHELEDQLGDPPSSIGARYMRRGKSGTVTIDTPRMRTREAFGPQIGSARESLRSIDSLYKWAKRRIGDA